MKIKKISCILFLIAIGNSVKAQGGFLDASFGTAGKVTTSFGIYGETARSVAIQSDGKIVVAGQSYNGNDWDFALSRYNVDGSLDNTFDIDGMLTLPFGMYTSDFGFSLVIQTDGKIIVAGSSDAEIALARFNTNGSLDNTFSGDGKLTTGIDIFANAFAMALQADGKIVVAGSSSNSTAFDIAVVRYTTSGNLDNTFSGDGKVTTDIAGEDDYAYSVAIQTDGKIVVAGRSFIGINGNFCLVRYNTNGSLDNLFSSDGMVITDLGSDQDYSYSIALQTDGKIVVAGVTGDFPGIDFALLRYSTNGTLDNTFSTDGIVITDGGTGEDDYAYAVKVQTDGKIVVAGFCSVGSNENFALMRYSSTGSLDNSFDGDGKVITDLYGSDDFGNSLAIQSDGKIIVVGQSNNISDDDFSMVRYFGNAIGINENEISNELNVFPNPTNTTLSVSYEKPFSNAFITIRNSIGQTIFTQNNLSGNNFTFDVSAFVNGIYFMELTDGSTISRTKFIKN